MDADKNKMGEICGGKWTEEEEEDFGAMAISSWAVD
jgi:hypothetical protein